VTELLEPVSNNIAHTKVDLNSPLLSRSSFGDSDGIIGRDSSCIPYNMPVYPGALRIARDTARKPDPLLLVVMLSLLA
jgi:hypothetical protein